MPQNPSPLLNNQHPQINYDPNYLFDTVIRRLGLKNDAALARHLEIAPPVISKTRNGKLALGASLLLRLHEATDISIKDLRALMGDHRLSFKQEQTKYVQYGLANNQATMHANLPASRTARTSP